MKKFSAGQLDEGGSRFETQHIQSLWFYGCLVLLWEGFDAYSTGYILAPQTVKWGPILGGRVGSH